MPPGTIKRQLLVIADDYGIGPRTSAGILELARKGIVTGSVLLVNSPHASVDVVHWQSAGEPMELGWHPNLTLDAPVLPPSQVSSLVNAQGMFWSLGTFMKKLFFGRIRAEHIAAELEAQLKRYIEMVGQAPRLVNSHQHIGIFSPLSGPDPAPNFWGHNISRGLTYRTEVVEAVAAGWQASARKTVGLVPWRHRPRRQTGITVTVFAAAIRLLRMKRRPVFESWRNSSKPTSNVPAARMWTKRWWATAAATPDEFVARAP